MFISPAYAQTGGGGGDFIVQLLPLVLIFAVFYFLLIRPQQKKAKAHREMLASIRRGDQILTAGGILGSVAKVGDNNELIVQIADGVRVRVARHMVADVLSRTEPVKTDGGAKPAEGEAERTKGGFGGLLGGKKR